MRKKGSTKSSKKNRKKKPRQRKSKSRKASTKGEILSGNTPSLTGEPGSIILTPLPLVFFQEWGYRAVLLKNGKLRSKGSFDIIVEKEFKKEVDRKHVNRVLSAKEVKDYGIIPVKRTSQGVEIQSRRTGDKKMLYY